MRRKKRSRGGFTLAETLMVVMILGLMTAAGAVGIGSVMATRISMVQVADAGLLGSTAFQAVANELRFGQNIQVDEGQNTSIALDSMTYGLNAKIELDKGRLKCAGSDILTESAYSGLTITGLTFERKDDGIEISLEVSGSKKDKTLWSGSSSVIPLNGLPPVTEP